MPLKVVCDRCGELLYYASSLEMSENPANFSIADIVFGENSKLRGQCPSCGRQFKSEDIAQMHVEITGKRADLKFFSKRSKPKRKGNRQFWVGSDFPTRIEPMWKWHLQSNKKR